MVSFESLNPFFLFKTRFTQLLRKREKGKRKYLFTQLTLALFCFAVFGSLANTDWPFVSSVWHKCSACSFKGFVMNFLKDPGVHHLGDLVLTSSALQIPFPPTTSGIQKFMLLVFIQHRILLTAQDFFNSGVSHLSYEKLTLLSWKQNVEWQLPPSSPLTLFLPAL